MLNKWLWLLLWIPTSLLGQVHEYESHEFEISYHQNLDKFHTYYKTTYIILDLENHELSYSQRNATGNWKMITYHVRAFFVDDEMNGIAVVKSGNMDEVIFNEFKHIITFEFEDGAYWEFDNVEKLR